MVKEKRRYLLIRGRVSDTLDELKVLFGEVGWGEVNPVVVWEKGDLQIARVSNRGVSKFRAANFLTANDVLSVSGCIRKLKKIAQGLSG
ncbi:MAG: hypothetical protein RXR41_02400 [Candidatus Marsarchaeota archaeon]